VGAVDVGELFDRHVEVKFFQKSVANTQKTSTLIVNNYYLEKLRKPGEKGKLLTLIQFTVYMPLSITAFSMRSKKR